MAAGRSFRIEVKEKWPMNSTMIWSSVIQRYAFFVMQSYLTDVWGLSFTHAAGILNIWEGIHMILQPISLHFLADFFGDFMMLVISGILNTVGMILISMSTPPVLANLSGTCKQYKSECIGQAQKVVFYVGMVAVAVALAGYDVSLIDFRREQNRKDDYISLSYDKQVLQGMISFVASLAPRVLAVAFPEGNLWWVRFAVPAIFIVLAMLVFLSGRRSYFMRKRQKSPITTMTRVFTACVFNISQPFPEDATKLYMPPDNETSRRTTPYLRFLEKAAIDVNPQDQVKNKWKVCSVEEVEEAKFVLRMIPMWMTFVMCGIVSSIGNTYFVEQLNHLSRKLGKWNVPLPVFLLFTEYFKIVTTRAAKSIFSMTRKPGEKKGILTPISGVQQAMIYSVLCCITAAAIERKRLNVVRSHGLVDKSDEDIPMGAYWLFFQFYLLAIGGIDVLKEAAATFYQKNALDSMVTPLQYFTEGVFGLSFISGVLSVHIVGRISERGGRPNWFQFTLNESRLDNYYWVLAALSSVNLVTFTVLAYVYYRPAPIVDQVTTGTEMIDDEEDG